MRLYEDENAVALDKPPGVSMATSRDPASGAAAVARLLAACGEPPDPGLLLVHRLDVGTSGVVLLAKSDAAHRALSRAFQSRETRKTYRALAWGHPVPAKGVFEDPLGRDPKDGRRMKVQWDGKSAVTRYETLARLPSVAELTLWPETGRTHQIRVHLASIGHAVVGDTRYGGARQALTTKRPFLHAERLSLAHPTSGEPVTWTSPLPPDLTELRGRLR